MKSLYSNLAIFFLVFIANSCLLVHSFNVSISNELRATLDTTCIVDNADGGRIGIKARHSYDFPLSSYANCTLDCRPLGLNGTYFLYDRNRDSKRCANVTCEWHVKNDGLFLNLQGQLVLQFPWMKKH
ncbi:hypothetical protein R3W88_032384 [Solanum pinnatisectum]|uniref:S-protein homolog n=1 Tax=Solanum pinnatisectum TaxID=50273 RepID=A0AAV9LSY4_9SOLN|nr:hypothetical protein R3W88_032384 [Solanum pinnatisectum]